ncbi:MAG: polysaccharide biosynthesis/export family protein, partial [Sedimentisphaerales bacterium]
MEYYRYSITRKLSQLLLAALLVSTFAGCKAPPTVSEMEAEHQRLTNIIQQQIRQTGANYLGRFEESVSPSSRVTLEPGDEIEVKFYYTPELDITQMVRPDGKISLQLIGELEVQGKTPAELREELLRLYGPHLKNPEVAVIVRSLLSRRVYVGGQVVTPGVIEMPAETDVLEAIMQAGGFLLPEAKVKNVIVIRHRDSQRYVYSVNLEPALRGDGSQPFY